MKDLLEEKEDLKAVAEDLLIGAEMDEIKGGKKEEASDSDERECNCFFLCSCLIFIGNSLTKSRWIPF